jgi:hypothetical protein
MSFLDSLENNLKALESGAERDPEALKREQEARERTRLESLAAADYAVALRNGPFTNALLTACRVIGHRTRTLVRPTWVESTLRLEAGDRRLEIRPTSQGVVAAYFEKGVEQRSEVVDLSSDAAAIAANWLETTRDKT